MMETKFSSPRKVYFDTLANFTGKQKEAEKALEKYKYVLYGGAMGGGKSYWLRWTLIKLLLKWAKGGFRGVRVGLFCEDYPALKDRHLSKIQYEFPEWLGILNKSDHEFALSQEYGNGVICFRNLDDPSRYKSSEFAAIAVDELTQDPKDVFDFLRTRLRWPGIEDTKFLGGTNPGGIGHVWVKKMWLDREFDPNEKEQGLFHFIPARASDNPHLSKGYFTSLEGLPQEMRKAFIEGSWDLFKGQYFSEWNNDIHTIHPFPIPAAFKKFRAYDHGRENPACCQWFAIDYDGRVYLYREYYQAGKNVDEIAEEIKRLSGDEQYQWSVADPSIFAKMGFVDRYGGQTIAEGFARQGITFLPASNRRVDGWNLMHQYLNWNQGKSPKLLFFNTCHNTIKTIPSLIHDNRTPEDLDSNGEDHAADATRYFLSSLHETKTEPPKTELEKYIEKKKEEESAYNFNDFYAGKFYKPEIR